MRGNAKDWGEQTKSKNEETKRELENEDKEREFVHTFTRAQKRAR